jgi:hypothetical protein
MGVLVHGHGAKDVCGRSDETTADATQNQDEKHPMLQPAAAVGAAPHARAPPRPSSPPPPLPTVLASRSRTASYCSRALRLGARRASCARVSSIYGTGGGWERVRTGRSVRGDATHARGGGVGWGWGGGGVGARPRQNARQQEGRGCADSAGIKRNTRCQPCTASGRRAHVVTPPSLPPSLPPHLQLELALRLGRRLR